MAVTLRDLHINRVALVDQGADPDADIVMFKRAPVEKDAHDPKTFDELERSRNINVILDKLWDQVFTFGDSMTSILAADEGDTSALAAKSLQQFTSSIEEALPAWVSGIIEKGDAAERTLGKWLVPLQALAKRLGVTEEIVDLNVTGLPEALRKHFEESAGATQEMVDATVATITERTTELETAAARVIELETEAKKDDADDKPEDNVLKGASPEVAALLQKQREDSDALQKRFDAEVEKREMRDFVDIAKAKYPDLPSTTPEAFGPLLYRVTKTLTSEDATALSEILAAASSITRANAMMTELGTTDVPGASDDEGELVAIQARLKAADPTLTDEKAYAKALDTPDGAEAYGRIQVAKARRSAGVSD